MSHWSGVASDRLRAVLSELAPIPDPEWMAFQQRSEPWEVEAGTDLLRSGERPRWILFLDSGLVRFYYLTPGGREFTKGFGRSGEVVAPLSAMVLGRSASYTIECLEPVRCLRFPCQDLERFYDRHPCWERVGRRLVEQAAVRKEVREEEFLLCDARERYDRFLKRYGDLVGRIPQRLVASYIGITDVALSRLRRRRSD